MQKAIRRLMSGIKYFKYHIVLEGNKMNKRMYNNGFRYMIRANNGTCHYFHTYTAMVTMTGIKGSYYGLKSNGNRIALGSYAKGLNPYTLL